MIATQIKVGDVLVLKRVRKEAYGMTDPFVKVEAIKPRPGYKTPWVIAAEGAFEPSDFQGRIL